MLESIFLVLLILLADRNESRRQAAVLVLKELAQNTPTLIYAYISQILDALWTGLRDQKVFCL